MAVNAARQRCHRGFTLIELLVVLTIVAIAAGMLSFALPSGATRQLEREADRLSALLEAARTQSRAQGRPVWWRAQDSGFQFVGLPEGQWPTAWLGESAPRVEGSLPMVLGPEPILPAQSLRLSMPDSGAAPAVEIFSDGISPFRVRSVQP